MRKETRKSISTVLTATMVMSMLTAMPASATDISAENVNNTDDVKQNQLVTVTEESNTQILGKTGDRTLEYEIPENIEVIDSVKEYYKLTGKKYKVPSGASSASSLPSSVDNSQSEYFPAIGSQGGIGACVAWSQTYYQFTYTMNKAMGVKTTPDNTFSPKWTYNLSNGGRDNGSASMDLYANMLRIGNTHLSMIPYDDDYLSWTPVEDVWKTAIKYRIKSYEYFEEIGMDSNPITSADDADLEPIKTALSNGEVLTFSTEIYSWKIDKIKTNASAVESNKYSGEEVVVAQNGTEGPHRMTIVGYNDNIWTDINNNNIVDNGEMGALKIANSWGDDYANDGFIWMAYDALNNKTSVEGAVNEQGRTRPTTMIGRIEVRPYNTGADLYLKYTANTSNRKQGIARIIAEKNGTIYERSIFPSNMASEMGKYSFDGTTKSNDGTMIYALDNIAPDVSSENLSDYKWSVRFGDKTKDDYVFTLKNLEIVDSNKNATYKTNDTFPLAFNGNDKTFEIIQTTLNNAVIYYRGYENPNIHYKVGNGAWVSSKGIPMEANKERRGYTHKYVVELNQQTQTTFYFSDEKGSIDNNNGANYTAGKGVSYYVTENVAEPLTVKMTNIFNSIADVDMYGNFFAEAKGGYEPYEYRFVYQHIESGSETSRDYSEYSNAGEYFRKVGDYRVTAYVKDFSDNIVSTSMIITVKDFPFEFSDFSVTPNHHIFDGQQLDFTAITKFEHIRNWGGLYNKFEFAIKKDDVPLYTETVKANTLSIGDMISTVLFSWTPTSAGSYSITVSTTDGKNEYAEKTLEFTVYEYNGTIIGDANNDKTVDIRDALLLMKYAVGGADESNVWFALSDCNDDKETNIRDVIFLLKYLIYADNTANTGKVNYREIPTEPPTEPPTEKPTETPTNPATKNIVTFTNSHKWGGTMYCYYWSDSNKTMTAWPGSKMTNAGVNELGETLYTYELPKEVTYIIFTNGSKQTVDISYSGGVVRYYPTSTTNSKGHYNVKTW
ncbi:MAG: starch-binding protein [Acutalibacteraceae bacterium]|nr:starch-binding protein [Acutalibacteraceae bacterium]